MTNLRSLKDVKEGKHTTLPDEIEGFPEEIEYPKMTLIEFLLSVAVGVAIALVIIWRIYA